MASQAGNTPGTALYLRPPASEIDAAPFTFYRTHLSQHLLCLHGFFGAAAGLATGEECRRLVVLLSNPHDAMRDETPIGAIQGDVSDVDLRHRFDRDRFAVTDRRTH